MSIPVSGLNPSIGIGGAAPGLPSAPGASAAKPVPEADKQDFASMMKGFGGNSLPDANAKPHAHEPSILEKFATVQHDNMKNMMQSSRDMVRAAPNMKLDELAMASIEFKLNMSVTTMQFQVATSVGKSAGKGVDTLMRNQ
ncbi:MAG: hypothetical protein V4695_06750 [Pseudomonadota bacterium]